MLPENIRDVFQRVKNQGENIAVKIETPDIVHATHELVDMLMLLCSKEKPSLYLVRPDRIAEYNWNRAEWSAPNMLSIDQSLSTVENSKNEFGVFIFWDLALRLDDHEGHPTVRSFIPNIFLSPKTTRKFIVFLEPLGTQYPNMVNPFVVSTMEPYPGKEEFLPMIKREASRTGIPLKESGQDEFALALLGLTYTGAQQMLLLAMGKYKESDTFESEALEYLNRQKEEILANTLGMSILKPTSDDIPYGLDLLMKDLIVHRSLICQEGQSREKGWLLIGTPGSGKSLLAKYLGYKLGYPAISFNISSIMNSLVGQTEKNMHNMCKVLETFAPCILYIDEFEKAIATGGENDGGTMVRAMGILFTWLNDTNAPVFFLASANNLDPQHGLALTRKGRFSQLYWVGEPCRKARYEICAATFSKKNVAIADDLLNEVADMTNYFSGADLVWLCNEAIIESKHYGHDSGTKEFEEKLFSLIGENKPRVETMKQQYDPLRRWAAAYCKPAGLPPEQ